MDYKTQYQMYLSQASAALEDACAKLSLIHISEPTRH